MIDLMNIKMSMFILIYINFKFNMNFHVLILVSLTIISVKPISFYFNLANTESKCFGEFFTEGSNGIYCFKKPYLKLTPPSKKQGYLFILLTETFYIIK
jgi:hypothetical protein